VVSVTFRRSRLAPLVTEVYISLVSHESLTERAGRFAGLAFERRASLPGLAVAWLIRGATLTDP